MAIKNLCAKYANTPIAEVIQPVGVTDEMIRSACPEELDLSQFPEASIYDITNGKQRIELGIPVVNPNYLYGIRPILPKLTGLSREDLHKIVSCDGGLVIESKDEKIPVGSIVLPFDGPSDSVTVKWGADAIEYLLQKNGHSTDGIILHTVPVLPRDFMCKESNCNPASPEILLQRVAVRAARLRVLEEMEAPSVILDNEKYQLRTRVFSLWNNGLHRRFYVNDYGNPFLSFFELDNILNHRLSFEPFQKAKGNDLSCTEEEVTAIKDRIEKLFRVDRTNFSFVLSNGTITDELLLDPGKEGEEAKTVTLDPKDRPALEENYKIYCSLEKEIQDLFLPSTERYLSQYFPTYTDFYPACEDEMRTKIQTAIESICETMDEEKIPCPIDKAFSILRSGIGRRMALYLSKNTAFSL